MPIQLFGGLEIRTLADAPVRLPTRKVSLLLAALVLAGQKGLRRETASATFWPDRGEAQARGSLRQTLTALRRIFPEHSALHVQSDLEIVRLVGPPEQADVWHFDRLIESDGPSELAGAAELYRGDLLDGVLAPRSVEEWFAPHKSAYRRKALLLVEQLSQLLGIEQHTIEACQTLADTLLAADPAAEEAHRALIRLYLHQGRFNAALKQFEICKEALRRELQTEPEAQTVELIARRQKGSTGVQGTGVTAMQPTASPAPIAPSPRDRDQPSVAVMPFDNLSGEADEYFVDGVVEEITAALSRVREFFVIARQSAFAYKGRFVDVRQIGRELGVSYVVEGTVRRGGDRLRISVQLVDTETRAQLWSGRYEGATTDVFEFQDQIAAQVAGAIHPAIRNAEIEMARRKPPSSMRAYDLVLRAYPNLWSHNKAKNREAISLLREAIAIDPNYGRAHALLAWCHSQEVVYLWSSEPDKDRDCAIRAVDAASERIEDDPTALAAAGAALSQCGEFDRAQGYIESALTLDPNNAWAWARYGWLALYRDDPDSAKERFERALALSPLDPLEFNLRIGLAGVWAAKGEYAVAAKSLREVLNTHPGITWAYRVLASTSALAGDLPAARKAIQDLLAADPNASIELMKISHPMRHSGRYFEKLLQGWRLAGLPEK